MDDGRGAQLPHTARTLCTPCALRGHACRLTCLHVVPMRRRVRAAGGAGEQKCSPGDCRPVRPGAACCIATHGAPWAREVCAWPMAWFGVGRYWVAWCAHFLCKKCVYVQGNGIVFFGSRRSGARKKAFFVHTVCAARACCVSWPVFAFCTHRSQGARGKPAWRAKVISGSFAFRKSRRERLKAYGLRAARL